MNCPFMWPAGMLPVRFLRCELHSTTECFLRYRMTKESGPFRRTKPQLLYISRARRHVFADPNADGDCGKTDDQIGGHISERNSQ